MLCDYTFKNLLLFTLLIVNSAIKDCLDNNIDFKKEYPFISKIILFMLTILNVYLLSYFLTSIIQCIFTLLKKNYVLKMETNSNSNNNTGSNSDGTPGNNPNNPKDPGQGIEYSATKNKE